MDYRNILMPKPGDLDIDLKLIMDPKQFHYEHQKTLQEYEEKSAKALENIFCLNSFYFSIFFSTALSERARKKTKQLEQEFPELFQPKVENPRMIAYSSQFGTNNPDIDRCVTSLLILYGNELNDGNQPIKTMSVVRAAYPRVYGICQAAGDATELQEMFFKLIHTTREPKLEQVTSDTLYLFCVLLWLHKMMGRDISMPDGILANTAFEALSDSEDFMSVNGAWKIDAGIKRRSRELISSLNGRFAPCTQIRFNTFFNEKTIQRFACLLSIVGYRADIFKVLEMTSISEREMQSLLASRKDDDISESDFIALFLLIKYFVAGAACLKANSSQTEKELMKYREQKAAEVPVDERLSEQQQKISDLSREVDRLNDKLRSASSNERAMAAEVAAMRKKLKGQEAETQEHQRDLRELAELRETVYKLMSEHDTPDAPQENDAIIYPYTDLPENIICVGGYEQWVGRMQERFPTVRFIPVCNRYDTGILRRAPSIWIQAGYISHIMYYRIVNDARAAKIDTHYFNSHSVESSSKLLIETMKKYK